VPVQLGERMNSNEIHGGSIELMEEHCDLFLLNIPKPNVLELLEPMKRKLSIERRELRLSGDYSALIFKQIELIYYRLARLRRRTSSL